MVASLPVTPAAAVAGPLTGGQYVVHEPLHFEVVGVSGANQYKVKPLALVSTVTPPIVAVLSVLLTGSWPPPGLFQRVGGEPADHAALTLRPGQLRSHHVGGAARVSVLAQRLRDDRGAADVDLERLAVVELLPG
jgi:hypothetical protein